MGRRRGLGSGDQLAYSAGGGGMLAVSDPAGASSNFQGMQPVGVALTGGFSDISQGRLSLIMLDTLIIAGIVWYLWTHSVQRGG